MTKQNHGLLLAISGACCWGISGTVAQFFFTHTGISTSWLTGIRLLFAGSLLLLYSKVVQHQMLLAIWRQNSSILQLLLFAFLGMIPSQFTYFMAIQTGNAATATILQFTGPMFIIIAESIARVQWPRRIDAFSIGIAMVGTFLLVTQGRLGSLSLAPAAVVWGMLAGVSQASYTLTPRKLLYDFEPTLVVGWSMLIGSIVFWPTLLIGHPHHLDVFDIMSVIFIIIFGTIIAYLFYLSSLNYLKPAITGVLSSFEPLTATILSIIFLGVHFNFVGIIGGVLILLTAALQLIPTRSA